MQACQTTMQQRGVCALKASLTVSSRASLNRPLRLLWRKALELPVLDIRILAKRAFYKNRERKKSNQMLASVYAITSL